MHQPQKVKVGEAVTLTRLVPGQCPICPTKVKTEELLVAHVAGSHGWTALLRLAQGRPWW